MISAEAVSQAFMDCLFRGAELITEQLDRRAPDDAKIVKAVRGKFAFHPERLEAHRCEVVEWLNELPPQFQKQSGGGWTFLNACETRDGQQWGEHQNMNELLALGIALGYCTFLLPRDMWESLPGGMPYIVIDIQADVAEIERVKAIRALSGR